MRKRPERRGTDYGVGYLGWIPGSTRTGEAVGGFDGGGGGAGGGGGGGGGV